MEITKCNENYTCTNHTDRYMVYKMHLSEYAAQVVASIATRRSNQWSLLSFLQPGVVLFTFYNHQRICFSKRGDNIIFKFKTNSPSKKLQCFSYRVLWIVQSPMFVERLQQACPKIDQGKLLLTFNEQTDMFYIRLCWTSPSEIPTGEVLVQTLYTLGTDKNSETTTNPPSSTQTEAEEETFSTNNV
jgi:hypothetical protein